MQILFSYMTKLFHCQWAFHISQTILDAKMLTRTLCFKICRGQVCKVIYHSVTTQFDYVRLKLQPIVTIKIQVHFVKHADFWRELKKSCFYIKSSIFKYLKLIDFFKKEKKETVGKIIWSQSTVVSGLDQKGTECAQIQTLKFRFQFLRLNRSSC